jgi:hypothetical protein
MPHAILKTDLNQLVMGYNKMYRIKTFLADNVRPSKDALIAELKRRNYKIVKVKGQFQLRAIKDPTRNKAITLKG